MPNLNNVPSLITSSLPPGAGVGIFDAIYAVFINDLDLQTFFGGRCFPGVAPPGTVMPYVVMAHENAVFSDWLSSAALNVPNIVAEVWEDFFTLSVYAEGYDTTRLLGNLVHTKFAWNSLFFGCAEAFVYSKSRQLRIDPKRSETGSDVWHWVVRYSTWTLTLLPRSDA